MTREEIEDIIDGLYDAKSDIDRNDISARRSREDIDKAIKALEILQAESVETLKQIPEACKNCSNHPSNGGSGICLCTLGGMKITC